MALGGTIVVVYVLVDDAGYSIEKMGKVERWIIMRVVCERQL